MTGFEFPLLPVLMRSAVGVALQEPAAVDPGGLAAETRLRGRLTFRLAASRGFCHGVERAVRLARETLAAYPDRRVFITSPILHNPDINENLRSAGVVFLSESERRWEELTSRDVVLLPAFGSSPGVRERLCEIGSIVVDTTCGSVVYVWKSVDRFARDGFTLVYHGRRSHEEAVATLARLAVSSDSSQRRSVPYIVLESMEDARQLGNRILGEVGGRDLPARLRESASPGFDPERDLERIGLASQTTMLASETLEITKHLREAQVLRFGRDSIDDHFRAQETICGATQERQDALAGLLAARLDLVLVVGGFESSNTAHLAELAAKKCPTYHIEGASGVLSREALRHKLSDATRPMITRDWLPGGTTVLGVTSGASTPESTLDAVIERVAEVAGAGS